MTYLPGVDMLMLVTCHAPSLYTYRAHVRGIYSPCKF